MLSEVAIVLINGPLELLASSTLTGLYIVCLIVGGGLLLVSTVFGGDAEADFDVDFEADVDIDLDADVDVDSDLVGTDVHTGSSSLALANWFSMHFLIYFAAAFGVVGTVLTFMSTISSNTVLLTSLLSGLVVGQGVHHLMRKVKKAEAAPPATARDYINKVARVTLALAPAQLGEVALMVRGRERYVTARPKHDDDHFKINDQVVVVAFNNGTAEIVSQKEYEFVTNSKPEDSHDANYTDCTN